MELESGSCRQKPHGRCLKQTDLVAIHVVLHLNLHVRSRGFRQTSTTTTRRNSGPRQQQTTAKTPGFTEQQLGLVQKS